MSRLLHERVEGSTAPKTVVRAAAQAWQTEATKTGKTMKRTQESRNNTQFQEEATAEARGKSGGGTAAGERPADGPAAASRATGTTRGPAISSSDGSFKRLRRTETSPSKTKGREGSHEPCSSGQMTLVLGRENERPDFARHRYLSSKYMRHVSCTSVVAKGSFISRKSPQMHAYPRETISDLVRKNKTAATPRRDKNINSKSDFKSWPRASFLCNFKTDTHRVAACSCYGPSLGTLARSEAHRCDCPSCFPVLCVLSIPVPLSCSSLTCTYALFGLFVCASVTKKVSLPRRRRHSGPQFSACGRPVGQPNWPMISCALPERHHKERLFLALLFSLVLSARLHSVLYPIP